MFQPRRRAISFGVSSSSADHLRARGVLSCARFAPGITEAVPAMQGDAAPEEKGVAGTAAGQTPAGLDRGIRSSNNGFIAQPSPASRCGHGGLSIAPTVDGQTYAPLLPVCTHLHKQGAVDFDLAPASSDHRPQCWPTGAGHARRCRIMSIGRPPVCPYMGAVANVKLVWGKGRGLLGQVYGSTSRWRRILSISSPLIHARSMPERVAHHASGERQACAAKSTEAARQMPQMPPHGTLQLPGLVDERPSLIWHRRRCGQQEYMELNGMQPYLRDRLFLRSSALDTAIDSRHGHCPTQHGLHNEHPTHSARALISSTPDGSQVDRATTRAWA